MNKPIGILGGIGPKATAYFMNMVIETTDAELDQEHINMVVLNHATIPDRTEYILGKSECSPENDMIKDAVMLEQLGCEFIVIPCNTAHYFFSGVKDAVKIPVINIIEETMRFAVKKVIHLGKSEGIAVGILATEGTVLSGIYQQYADATDVKCIYPDQEYQKEVNKIIYARIKAGDMVCLEEIVPIISHMKEKGCDAVVMGCTELSIVSKDLKLEEKYPYLVDSLNVLARETVLRSGKQIKKNLFTENI